MSIFGHGSWDTHASYASEGECDENGFGGTAIIKVWFAEVNPVYACQPRYSVIRCNGKSGAGENLSWAISTAENWGDDYVIESCWLEDKEAAIATEKSVADLKIYAVEDCKQVLADSLEPEPEPPEDSEDDSEDDDEDSEEGTDTKIILALAAVAAVAMFA